MPKRIPQDHLSLVRTIQPRQWFAGFGEGNKVDSGDGGVGEDFDGGFFGGDAVEIQHGDRVTAVVGSAE